MENVAKALLIAAGMFMAILILSALVMSYNEISSYYEQKHELTVAKQTEKFNKKFEAYNRNNVRGSELISFMNKVIDYNASEVYNEEKGYKRILVTIDLIEPDIIDQFKYNKNETYEDNDLLKSTITNTNPSGTYDWDKDKKLVEITDTPRQLIEYLNGYGISNVTDKKLQQLASEISTIMVTDTDHTTWAVSNRHKRVKIIKDIFDIDFNVNDDGILIDHAQKGQLSALQVAANKYYQYMQFKRAYFDCTEMIYDAETNRVVEIKFTLKTEGGNVVFN